MRLRNFLVVGETGLASVLLIAAGLMLHSFVNILRADPGLRPDGHHGVDGLALAEEFQPDAALLDLRLPRMDGYEVAQRIREQPWGKGMVLIALTGWGQEEAKQLSRDVGFDQHLVKPVNPADLLELVASLHQTRTSVA